MNSIQQIKARIRNIPDFPKKGIQFKDITPILSDHALSQRVIELLLERMKDEKIDAVAGIESRGFLFGMALAQKLGVGFIPIRKKGKLPSDVVSVSYELEYGFAEVEMHSDALKKGMNIHIHDDLLATGGTAKAAAQLIQKLGGIVPSFSFIIELESLNGRAALNDFSSNIEALVVY